MEPLIKLRDIEKFYQAGPTKNYVLRQITLDIAPGEFVTIMGPSGAGKSTLVRTLSGAHPADSGDIRIDGESVDIGTPKEAKDLGIETIYQTLALADNQNAPANMFLGRELKTRMGNLDDSAMESETRGVIQRLNPNFNNFKSPVKSLSGGQRQAVAIARAVDVL